MEFGDFRECTKATYVVDEETGEALFQSGAPGYVQGTITLDDGWTITGVEDVTPNDSNKQWEVPVGQEWQILWIQVEYISSGTAGNRQLEVGIARSGALYTRWAVAGATQAASLTRYYTFAPGLADLTSFRDTDYLTTPLPVTSLLQGGDTLQIFDNKAIDAAADDMSVRVQYGWRAI